MLMYSLDEAKLCAPQILFFKVDNAFLFFFLLMSVQTIVLIPLLPHGVLQLGSLEMVSVSSELNLLGAVRSWKSTEQSNIDYSYVIMWLSISFSV